MEKERTISGNDLVELVRKNPDWIGERVTEDNPLTVTTACGMTALPIRQLSPFITFQASADFSRCLDLKAAEGEFHQSVNFSNSGIEEIGDLRVLATYDPPNKERRSVMNAVPATLLKNAVFSGCKQLRVARGYFLRGVVDFTESGIEEIDTDPVKGLRIEHASPEGVAALFRHCTRLKVAEGKFPGKVEFTGSGIEKIGNLDICGVDENKEAVIFSKCESLKTATGRYPGVARFDGSGVTNVKDLSVIESYPGRWKSPVRFSFRRCPFLIHVPIDYLDNPKWEIEQEQKERIRNAWLARRELKQWNDLEL